LKVIYKSPPEQIVKINDFQPSHNRFRISRPINQRPTMNFLLCQN
jgi:hypothetical protein